ncbi:Helicase conserved C-terminal domain-containing protein [Fodinibius salinus]|uniref:Helicase conserved C-terminal domain-containing protein n=1 Tax=Fodinibius salinus TaxID=860790 RepID=A0A5D3YI69_9BACT|nr:helicase-related protein [Fodinibius salinus]TYP93544.1 Helicase conserved C-terminal domain-containing protein [Fodinibius salinus]
MRDNPTVTPFEDITTDDYPGIFGDFDGDGIPNADDPNPQLAGDTETVEETKLTEEIKQLIALREDYQQALNEVIASLKDLHPTATVKGRVKSPYSVINKLRRKRIKGDIKQVEAGEHYMQGLTDMAGCMIMLGDQTELDQVVQKIASGTVGNVFEHEDKYAQPVGGYRAHHFIVMGGPAGDIPVEVQVKTKRMAKIASAAHTPYKNGMLNARHMHQLTNLAWQADQGNDEAANQIDALLDNPTKLTQQLTTRENPSSELQVLQESFIETVKKLALSFSLDKFPTEHREQALQLFREHGNIIGVDFDSIFSGTQHETPTPKNNYTPSYQPSGDRAGETEYGSDFSGLQLENFAPIKLSKTERRRANEAALAVLEKEDRAITKSDLDLLRQYTGAGGLGYGEDATGTERGLLNEHYTSYPLVHLIWKKLQAMGVDGGNILEPGAGVGNFAGFMPNRQAFRMLMVERSAVSSRIAQLLYPSQLVRHENFAQTDLSLYNLTGAIGNVPFGDIKIHTQRDPLARLNPRIHDYFILKSLDALQPGGFLAVITSVGTMDKKDPAIRQAMVQRARFVGAYRLPSTAFKDNADTLVTTDLILFQKYPDVDGETHPDINSELNQLFAYQELAVSITEHNEESYGAYYNPYFQKYPEQVLGEHIQGHDMQFLTRMGVKGQVDQAMITRVLEDNLEFPYPLPESAPFYRIPDEGVRLNTGREYHAGNIIFHEDKFYEKQRHYFKPITVGNSDKAGEGLRAKISSACQMLDTYDDFVTALAQDTAQKEPLRGEFKQLLGTHIDTYGIPDEDEDIRKVFPYDNRLYKLTTFVKRDPISSELVYADIIDADSMFNDNYVPAVSDSDDLAEIAMYGRSIGEELTLDFYQSTYKGGTASRTELTEAIEEHPDFFYNPESNNYEFRYQYLAGNVRRKLEIAEDNQLEKNIEALKAVLPEWIDAYSITVDPRHVFTYLPTKVLTEWIKDELGYRDVHIGLVKDKADLGNRFYMKLRKGGRYIKNGEETADDWNQGWGETPFSKIINNYIQDSSFPLVFYDEDDNVLRDMTLKRADQKGLGALIERARAKQRTHNDQMLTRVPQKFNQWVRTKASTEIRELIEQAYNHEYNAHINPQFDGNTLRVRGMSDTFYGVKDFAVYKHNRAVAEKLVWNGRGANCHDVGAGKTLASIITSQVLAQQGACRKPMFVVPGKVQEKWVEEYSMLFPDAKILNMKMAGSERHRELTMAQLYSWDAIFIADHAFKSLPLSPDVQQQMYSDRVEYFDQMIEHFDELIEEDDALSSTAKKSMVTRLEKMKEEWEAKLRNVASAKRLDTDIFFDELGVDALFFDEAHFYKNALGSAKAAKLGIAANKPSQRAEDALQKTKWLFSKIGFKNVFVLTATPVVNSPVEVWHMLNLCAPDLLEKYQIANLDNFINQFVREEEKIVKKTNGEYRTERVVGGYYNLPEMRSIIDEVMDIKSYDQLVGFYEKFPDLLKDEAGNIEVDEKGNPKTLKPKFKRPEAETKQQVIEPSEIHKLLFDDIILRADNILDCMRQRGCQTKDNFLVITGDGSKIATDLRVYDNSFKGVDGKFLKLGALTRNVAESYAHRENPTPSRVSESIYGDFFSKVPFARENPNPYEGRSRNKLIRELKSLGHFDEVTGEIEATEGDLHAVPVGKQFLLKKIEKQREKHSDGSDQMEETFDRAIMIVEALYAGRENPTTPVLRNQIIFCDWISVEGQKGGSYHQLIKEELAKAGIPATEIAIINGSIIGTDKKGDDYFISSSDDKEALKKQVQDDFNIGKYRVLIGNQSIAEGMNLQKWTTDLHHMDVPYTPSQIQQRNGRGLRQGNQHGKINIHFYLMKDSFDQYRLELVSKKQSWIDELFFGDGRETSADSEGESLEYEQMVAATNSDPRVKEFFQSKAQTKVLKNHIESLLSETQRLKSSLGQANQDVTTRTERMESAIAREQSLIDWELPASAQQALDNGLIRIGWLDYSGEIGTIENNLSSDGKRVPRFRHELSLEVPKNNANGRVLFNLIPDPNAPNRSFYNKIKWSSIKQMAGQQLTAAFGWSMNEPVQSGRSLAGNKGNIIADESDFYTHYEIDIEAEKSNTNPDGTEVTYDQIKQKLGMYKTQQWLPIIKAKLAALFLALEKGWQQSAQARIQQITAELDRSKKTLKELEITHEQTRKELEQAQANLKTNQDTVTKLQDVVNELVKTEFSDRSELYEELNRIAPTYGVKGTVRIREVGIYRDSTTPADDIRPNRSDSQKKEQTLESLPTPLKTLYGEPLVYAGTVGELEFIDAKGFMQRILSDNQDMAMIIDGEGTTLFAFPTHRMKLLKSAVDSDEATRMYEEFHHFPPDEYDYELFPPADAELVSVGHADRIMYASDKVIYPGDEKGENHQYYHYFDDGKRPIFQYGDVYIITNLNIDGRGILN